MYKSTSEAIINLHMHTTYSDGSGSHRDIAQAALKAGLDAVIVTDHNVLVQGLEDYHSDGERRVLLLIGEEIHDQARQPQKSHLLVFGANQELAPFAYQPQKLIDEVKRAGGLCFIAHPVDPAAPAVGEDDISWVDWDVQGYTGIELWNGFSEFKTVLKSMLHAVYYVFQPERIARGPLPETLQRWDLLLASGQRVVAVGGSDAHQLNSRLGPLKRVVFPYEFHFRSINTHLLLSEPLNGELEHDRNLIYAALRAGRAFIGYDLPAPTRGFRFTAQGSDEKATIGEEISALNGVTFQIRLPQATSCRLIRNGELVGEWQGRQVCTHITNQPGAYRVEAHIPFHGKPRGWIYSNPIYVKPA